MSASWENSNCSWNDLMCMVLETQHCQFRGKYLNSLRAGKVCYGNASLYWSLGAVRFQLQLISCPPSVAEDQDQLILCHKFHQ